MLDSGNVAIAIFIVALVGFGEIVSQVEREDRMHRVNVPILFNMEKAHRGGHLDVSVLSGLIKVQREGRTNSTDRSLLRRPISVSVFGIPVYQRGNGNFDQEGSFGGGGGGGLFGDGGIFGRDGIGGILFGRGNNGDGGGSSDEPTDEDTELDP